ncbi:MAG: hypothetical protein KGJ13_00385 [Patescibacteria group bacterium]|nr:hypothetical protein [Patescibacteria group bacterium]
MSFSLVYLFQRFFFRIYDFFHHWYVDGSRAFGRVFIRTLEETDKVLAIKITLRYFFQPLYGDYTAMGRILGVIFRTGRILVGAAVYTFLIILFAAAFAVWIAAPAAILMLALK